MEKVCPGCGEKFSCLGTEKCWCHDIKLPDTKLEELRSCADDCFCERCILLKKYKTKSQF